MSKKLFLVLMVVVFLSGFRLAEASISISEVKISPIEDRFIRLYNSGSSAQDLSGWYIQRKTSGGESFGSLVSKTNFENKKIGAGESFLISRGLPDSDIVLGSLTLTESNAIQIKNTAGEVVDKICWGEIDECGGDNQPNPETGEIIKPGSHSSSPEADQDEQDPSSSDSDDEETKSAPAKPKTKTIQTNPSMKAEIIASATAFTGEPFEVKANIYGFSNEDIFLGKIYWNFGDGDSLEQAGGFKKFYHTYFYPGEYLVSLEYYRNSFSQVPDATAKMTIKAAQTSVVISRVGDAKDFFIELTNNAGSNIDISSWVLNASGKIFVLPRNSIIAAKKQMIISGRTTGFTFADRYSLKLFSRTGDLAFDYSPGIKISRAAGSGPPQAVNADSTEPKISRAGLAAASVESGILPTSVPGVPASFIPYIFTVFLGGGAFGIYYIRRHKSVPAQVSGSDFEILDE